jgi:hypothetical protein
MIAALVMVLFLLGYSFWSLFHLGDAIAGFTSPAAKPVALDLLDDRQPALAELTARLAAFRDGCAAEPARESSLALSADDLNLAIAAFDAFKDLRHTLRVREINADCVLLDISFPVNGRPFSGERRYLNGTLTVVPEMAPGEVVLRVTDIQVPGARVPREFVDRFSPYRVFERYRKDPVLGPPMQRLTGLSLGEGKIVVRAKPGELPAGAPPATPGKHRFAQIAGLAACLFLLFAGTVVFVGLRKSSAAAHVSEDEPRR